MKNRLLTLLLLLSAINLIAQNNGQITGDFSLNDFDQLIIKTQTELVLRLSSDLKSKI